MPVVGGLAECQNKTAATSAAVRTPEQITAAVKSRSSNIGCTVMEGLLAYRDHSAKSHAILNYRRRGLLALGCS